MFLQRTRVGWGQRGTKTRTHTRNHTKADKQSDTHAFVLFVRILRNPIYEDPFSYCQMLKKVRQIEYKYVVPRA